MNKNILIISGGSGSEFLHRGLVRKKNISINFLINLYDDGKSTGELRKYFDYKILGPSDLRKIQGLEYIANNKRANKYNFFNYRFSTLELNEKINKDKKNILEYFKKIHLKNYPKDLQIYIEEAVKYFFLSKKKLKSKDLSLANLVYSYLAYKFSSYNLVEKKIREIFNLKNKVYFNDIANYFIFAINDKGQIIKDEELIVNYKKTSKLKDIYFSKNKLENKELKKISHKKKLSTKIKFLQETYPFQPNIDNRTKNKLIKSDIIIFSPGTQFSSLFPTYLTNGVVNNISKHSKKILIMNLINDFDTRGYTLSDYFNKIAYFLSSKNKNIFQFYEFFDYILLNKSNKKNKIKLDITIPDKYKHKFIIKNFENRNNVKFHDFNKIKSIIYKLIKNETKN